MTEPTAILIPAKRRHRFDHLVANIHGNTPEPHTIYWAVDEWDDFDALNALGEHNVWVDHGDTWGHRLNFLFHHSTEPLVFLGADDVRFHPRWLEHAQRSMVNLPDSSGVVSVNDGLNPAGTLALVARSYIETYSGCIDTPEVIIYPGYHHRYSETELYQVARFRGRFAMCPASLVEHLHWSNGKSPHDEVYAAGDAYIGQDTDLYVSRQHLWGEE